MSQSSDAPSRLRLPAAIFFWIYGGLAVLTGAALTWGGVHLIALGGSWYYGLAGVTTMAVGVLLIARRFAGVWLYAALAAATLVWALIEAEKSRAPRASGVRRKIECVMYRSREACCC